MIIGQLLAERYKIIEILGMGGFGATFLGEDSQRPGNPKCVVKQLQPPSTDANFINTVKKLFFTEAEALVSLGEHSQIPRLLAYLEQDQQFYLVEEYIDGYPLSQEFQGQRWSEMQVVQLLQEVLNILEFIHIHNVIHQNIKPSNILRRRRDGKLVLIDFGDSQKASDSF